MRRIILPLVVGMLASLGIGLTAATSEAGDRHDAASAAKAHRHVVKVVHRKVHGAQMVTPFANGKVAVTPIPEVVTATYYSDGSGTVSTSAAMPHGVVDQLQALEAQNGGAGALPTDQELADFIHSGVSPQGPSSAVSNPLLVNKTSSQILKVTPRTRVAATQQRATSALPSGALCTGWHNYSENDIHDNTCSTFTGISRSAYHTHGIGSAYSNDGQHGDSCNACDHLVAYGSWGWVSSGQVTDWSPSTTISPSSCRNYTFTVGYGGTSYAGSHTECADSIGPWNLTVQEDGAKWGTSSQVHVSTNGVINYRDAGFETVTSAVSPGSWFQVGQTVWYDHSTFCSKVGC